MAEVAIIAIVVVILAITIGKANQSSDLIWRLLFCFSVSVCLSVGFLYIFNSKPKASAENVTKIDKADLSDTTSHTVFFDQIAMEKDSSFNTVGKDNVQDTCLIQTQVTNQRINTPKLIREHAIYDSS